LNNIFDIIVSIGQSVIISIIINCTIIYSIKNIEIRSLEIKQSLDMLHVSLDRDALAREFQEDINWMNDSFDI
jgi:hypothetical protein